MLVFRSFALGIVVTLGLSVIGALSVSSHTTQDAQGFQRARDADVARWVAIGEAYTQRDVANMQRAGYRCRALGRDRRGIHPTRRG